MKTLIRKIIILSLLLSLGSSVVSQSLTRKELIKAVHEADILYYYDQDYEKAAVQYESLLNIYPDNSNFAAKLGICYLNSDGRKSDALRLLKKASENVIGSEKEYIEFGEKAPLDTYLYLAVAYHQNDSLQKAITSYYDAKKRLDGTKIFREEYIDNQIRDCKYAMEMKKKPLTIISDLFIQWLSEYPGACNPVLARNDSVFIFTQKEDGKTRILCSYKSKTWQRPVDITRQLGGFDRFYSNSITGDGKLLIIYMDDGGDGNLYYSQRTDTTWTKIKSLGKPINTIYWQSHGFITPDGKAMYFASNKPGGEGELDIWVSEKTESGAWGEPVNCGNVINTPFNEDTPYFDQETGALLFSSVGHVSMGGYDVFRSTRRNGGWTNPVGIPYAFNNSLENTFFILNNNAPGFITSIYNEKTKSRNIFAIVAENPADKITIAGGTVTLQDGMIVDPKQTRIILADLKKATDTKTIQLIDTSSFKFEVKPGDYQLLVSHEGYKTDTINLNVPLYFSGNYISVNASLMPDKVFEGAFLAIKNILFEFNSYKLDNEALTTLKNLKSILVNYPELKIEVAGYTDAKGASSYNKRLANSRAEAVIRHLTESGISGSRFVKKAFGESNFAAVNTNNDGTDNPEGRKYNRRASFGIIDPQTGVIIRQESYTPEHLRQPLSMRYSLVLLKTKDWLKPDYFSGLINNDLLFVRTIKVDSLSMYVLGVFYNKTDALKYLDFARKKGLDKAYILNQYDLANVTKAGRTREANKCTVDKSNQKVYTIQLKASKSPLNMNQIFNGLEGVSEIKASDGLYKYYYGEYQALSKAKEGLESMKKLGFNDAFIRDLTIMIFQ